MITVWIDGYPDEVSSYVELEQFEEAPFLIRGFVSTPLLFDCRYKVRKDRVKWILGNSVRNVILIVDKSKWSEWKLKADEVLDFSRDKGVAFFPALQKVLGIAPVDEKRRLALEVGLSSHVLLVWINSNYNSRAVELVERLAYRVPDKALEVMFRLVRLRRSRLSYHAKKYPEEDREFAKRLGCDLLESLQYKGRLTV